MVQKAACVLAALMLSCLAAGAVGASATVDQLQQTFLQPPDSARPMVRWWWFGPAVTEEGITRELNAMKAGGFGGVEVQSTYPLAVDTPAGERPASELHPGEGIKNLKFLSPEHLHMIGFAAGKCKELGLRMDLTLGSGWPYGGPMFTASEGAGRLETQVVAVKAGEGSVAFPRLRPGSSVIAAFVGPAINGANTAGGGERRARGSMTNADVSGLKPIAIADNAAHLPAGFAGGDVVFFIAGRTGMQVKRPAFGAEGNVIDHLSAKVVDKFIQDVAEPEIKACGSNPPYAIFCDSLEVQGENWTDDFLAEFQKRRGYDLMPYLPGLIGNIGARTDQVRYDFGRTVTELYNENFSAKFKALAAKYGTRFRVQDYGSPPAGLESYAYADLPEGEAGGNGLWRNFRSTRYAASASHLMNLPVTSSETFTWLHTAPFRATPLDVKGEVDTHFLDGINQVICHGWPYTGNEAKYPGWSFYAAAVFDDKNPWYVGMPAVTGYITRMSAVLREGVPVEDVALYLPDSDVWAHAGTGFSSLNAAWSEQGPILDQVLDAGYNLDGWDDGMLAMKGKVEGGTLAFGEMKYKVVVLPAITRMPLATARQLEAFAKGGGTVIALKKPTVAPGLHATEADQQALAAIMDRIFGAEGGMVVEESELGAALHKKLQPDVTVDGGDQAIGVVHRHTDAGEVYFLANTSNEKKSMKATFRVEGMSPELWNPLTKEVRALPTAKGAEQTVTLDLAPYGSDLVVWTKRVLPAAPAPVAVAPIDLSSDWAVTFKGMFFGELGAGGGGGKAVRMAKLTSWTDLPGMKNFSGVATYTKTFTVTPGMAAAPLTLAFGDSKPGSPDEARAGNGFAAQLQAPVRDVAVVYINGKKIGTAWCPPYTVDVSGALKEGENTIRIDVGNTAVNYLAKAGFPNYDLAAVRDVYGRRFDPQGLQLYRQPLPSGLLGPITIGPRNP